MVKPDFKNKDIISVMDLSREDILYLCDRAHEMYGKEKSGERHFYSNLLEGRVMGYMFYEPSTRTALSFQTAIRELGAKRFGFTGSEGTSVKKKESIRDTVMMMHANHPDILIMRQSKDGSAQWAADVAEIPVISGGDGKNEHPTQALLDIATISLLKKKNYDSLDIVYGGDLSHGRTVRSGTIILAKTFKDIKIRWAADDYFGMPKDLEEILVDLGAKVIREKSLEDGIKKSEILAMTRPQISRLDISEDEAKLLVDKYRITLDKIAQNPDIDVMHPLPVNSNIAEIEHLVFFTKNQQFYLQAEMGIFLRKALIYEELNHDGYISFSGKLNNDLKFGNNKLMRTIKENPETSEKLYIDKIVEGTVIDHIMKGTNRSIDMALDLNLALRGYAIFPGINIYDKSTDLLKTSYASLTERESKLINIIQPDATINYIRNNEIVKKFIYLLCKNDNCITREINEDVPPKFFYDESQEVIRCRYCRRSYDLTNAKVSEMDLGKYIANLPVSVEKIQ